ncbi:MAG: BatD family protein [Candidatus Omnitrophota bacterium]
MKQFFLKLIIAGIVVTALTGVGWTADMKFEVSLDRERLALGETAQLGLSFRGTQSMPAPDIGNIDGLEVRYIGPSTMMTVINGQVSSSVTHMYIVQPLRVGKFQIGPFAFRYKNDNYASNTVVLTVTEEKPLAQRQPRQMQEEPAEKMNLEDRIFVTLNLDKPTAYVNELIPVTVKLYVNQMNVSDIQLPAFSQEGFSKVEFKEPKQYRERMGGLTYDVLEFRTNLYATRPGDYKVGPARVKCNIVVRRKAARGGAQDDYFGNDPALRDSFFDDFLARYEKQPTELKSDEIHLIVSPLPVEGRPKDFSGAVGDYQFIFAASPTKVKTGDPVTVRMTINGTGNFNTVLSPKLDNAEGFKAYEPEVKTQENSKAFTQVLIPETEKITQVPRATFSYFDPVAKTYKTITQGPIPLGVEKAKEELPSKVVGPAPAAALPEAKELASDIIFIKEVPGRWLPRESRIYTKSVFWMAIFIPFALLTAIYIVVGRMNRIKYDVTYASRRAAFKVARYGMKTLRHKLKAGDSRVFYETLFKTMQEYLGYRLHLPPAGLTFDMVSQKLVSTGIDISVITGIRGLFTVCDEARFGFSSFKLERMTNDYKELESVMKYMEHKRS